MVSIIDRRIGNSSKDKNVGNRQRYIRRTKNVIKPQIKEAIAKGNIRDLGDGKVRIPVKGTKEPSFRHDPKTGKHHRVLPGNDRYLPGDTQEKPPQSGAGRGQQGSESGSGEDDFEFMLSREEFTELFLEDLELPDLLKKQLKEILSSTPKRTGFTNSGNPSNIDVTQTMLNGFGRRIGLKRPKKSEIDELLALIEKETDEDKKASLQEELDRLRSRMMVVPYLDLMDTRYRNFTQQPSPNTQAVIFFLMDVSGSMGEAEKNVAKMFFVLLYMILTKKYSKVEIVFVRHHHEAEECDEHTFFHKRETGGTIVSSGLELIHKIIKERFPVDMWNIYCAQASDGDNWPGDNNSVTQWMRVLLPLCQYYAYVDVRQDYMDEYGYLAPSQNELWEVYENLKGEFNHLVMKEVPHQRYIWSVIQELFSKDRVNGTS